MRTKTEHVIRNEFPGENNRKLRESLRLCAEIGNVLALERYIGLTGHFGKPALVAVQRAIDHDIKISDIESVTLNGRAVKSFKAWSKSGNSWVFAGQFSAPKRATYADMFDLAETPISIN